MIDLQKYEVIEEENADRVVTERIIQDLNRWNVFRGAKFDAELLELVGELRDRGIEIEEFLNSSRRIVFRGKYNGREVVIKFSHAVHTIDHDELQQQKEEMIWDSAKEEGDEKYFAEIFFGNLSSKYVVQEYCHDIEEVDDPEILEEEYQNIAAKYNIREFLLGKTSDNKIVFVDYGN